MELPERQIFLVGFGWAGLVSLLTWVVPVTSGGAFNANLMDLGFGVLILGGVTHAVYTGARENPSTVSVAFAVFAAFFATVQLVAVLV